MPVVQGAAEVKDRSGRAFYAGLLQALTEVMGSANGYLRDHGCRVGLVSKQVGSAIGLSAEENSRLFLASVLSDMGMVGLAEDAWESPTPCLSPEVRARVERHPARAEERLTHIPHLEMLAPLVRHHHEWWDGSGYPDGLRGDEIPLLSQILRLSDTVVALESPRPHRGPLSKHEILEIVERSAGTEFGPEVARTYLALSRAGELFSYDVATFRHTVARAAENLLPEQVSPLSADQLLAIVANLIDAKDRYTAGHSGRVAVLAVAVADQLGIPSHITDTLRSGGYLHDLGKLRVPLRVLAKPGRLTDEEFRMVKQHPSDGASVLGRIPSLRHLTTGARYHHEKWDGTGYPEGLSGDHIPVVAQIMAVCDSYDAMTSMRAYRDSRSHADAVAEVARCVGSHFSPLAADAFLSLPGALFVALQTQPLDHLHGFSVSRRPQAPRQDEGLPVEHLLG
jgi:HD-GYP domain-containing protein (c-di-GMP phosphodiesterase class II)